MATAIINSQMDAINESFSKISSDLTTIRPLLKNASIGAYPTDSASGAIASFTDGAEDVPVKELKVNLEPVQSGTGDPSPTNIRPISGHDSVNVYRTGKNLMPISTVQYSNIVYENGYYNVNSTTTGAADRRLFGNWGIQNAVSLGLNEGTYTWSQKVISVDGGNTCVARVRVSPHGTEAYQTWNVGTARHINSDDKFFILLYFGEAATYNCKISIQLELGSTATDYEPYAGQTYPIPLGQTVYGGTLNVNTGALTIDRAMVDFGTLTWTAFGSVATYGGLFYSDSIKSVIKHDSDNEIYCACSMFASVPNSRNGWIGQSNEMPNNSVRVRATDGRLYLRADSHIGETGADFKTAMNGVQLVYYLATPTTVQLTAAEVTTLLGQNNIWADCGDVEVTYRADTGLYIDKKLAQALNA